MKDFLKVDDGSFSRMRTTSSPSRGDNNAQRRSQRVTAILRYHSPEETIDGDWESLERIARIKTTLAGRH
jgi:hypothetical protein